MIPNHMTSPERRYSSIGKKTAAYREKKERKRKNSFRVSRISRKFWAF